MPVSASIPIGVTADDLAPADLRSAEFDWTGFRVSFINSPNHPRFIAGYTALWDEFGDRNEMEQRSVIEERMRWRPEAPTAHHALLYEMIVITHDDELAAVRDHTAIVDLQNPEEPAVVHLSHILVFPAYRGGGISGWLRAMPIRTARECLARAFQVPRPINLVAEMEPSDPSKPERMHRLSAYQKVGFVKVDPRVVHYLQPDFRAPADIDATGGPRPVSLSLIVRRVKRESDSIVPANEVRTMVDSLYTMYAQTFRATDMQPNWDSLRNYPTGDFPVELVPPIPSRLRVPCRLRFQYLLVGRVRNSKYLQNLEPRYLFATLSGLVWNDADTSAGLDESESTLPGVTVYMDSNHNGRFDSGEPTDVSDPDGVYSFKSLAAGTYDLGIVPPTGFGVSAPSRFGSLTHQFDIGLNFLSTMTASQARLFTLAAERWEAIIVGDLPADQTNIGLVDDIVLDIAIIDIDGPGLTLAQGEPTDLRSGTFLPSRGVIEFDVSDIESLEDDAKLLETITHEMAHCLGFGTIWSQKGLISGASGSNPIFTGTQARAQYNSIFSTSASGVPLEAGGGGTGLSHWRETVLLREQMTGFTELAGVFEPISRVTIAQFADLGYTVNLSAADSWNPGAGTASPWRPVDSGVKPLTRRVVITGSEIRDDADFGIRANKPPVVLEFTASPTNVQRSAIITLSARAVDPNADPIVGMTFYRDSNGIAGLQSGSDTYIATKFTTKRGVFMVTTSSDALPSGGNIFYAVAIDEMLAAGKRSTAVRVIDRPIRPNPVVATVQSNSTTLLQWRDRSDNEIGFRVEIAINNDFSSGLVRHFNVPANTRSVLISGLTFGVTYFYRVRAYNEIGPSAYTTTGGVVQA